MQLFYTPSSPFALCVRRVISEFGINDQVTLTLSQPFNDDKEFLAANPLGKVPCLLDQGESLLDSEVICDYLDAQISGGTLFNPVYADWRLKSLYSVCNGLMDLLVARRIEATREADGLKSDFWWQRHNFAINRTLAYIQEKLPLMPEEFSILHITLLSALDYLEFRHQDIKWRVDYASLNEFQLTFCERPSIKNNLLE